MKKILCNLSFSLLLYAELPLQAETNTFCHFSYSVVGRGDVDVNPTSRFSEYANDAVYQSGTVLTLTAIPGNGFTFCGWGRAGVGETNQVKIVMNSSKSVTAVFWPHTYGHILFQNRTNNKLSAWIMNDTRVVTTSLISNGNPAGKGWRMVSFADFDNDGSSDILWQHADGRVAVWYMQSIRRLQAVLLNNGKPVGKGWRAVGLADIDGQGSKDILWQHDDGRIASWCMSGNFVESIALFSSFPFGWKLKGQVHWGEDTNLKLLLQHTDGRLVMWLPNVTEGIKAWFIRGGKPVSKEWLICGLSDFDRNGSTDILWQNTNGKLAIWHMEGSTLLSANILTNWPSPVWKACGAD